MLELENVSISYDNTACVKEVSFSVKRGEIFAVVGESGSGKTTLLRAVMGLLPETGRLTSGNICLNGEDLIKADPKRIRQIRGSEISLIFQSPVLTLDPLFRIKDAFTEVIRIHKSDISKKECLLKCFRSLEELGFTDPDTVMNSYPFELSGGMCQRISIGMAMVHDPGFLLADEPTSALDVNSQMKVMDSFIRLREEKNTGILFVTHNMGLAANMADHIAVMRSGRMVECAKAKELVDSPMHPYTKILIDSVPGLDGALPKVREETGKDELLSRKKVSESHWFLG